MIAFILSMPNRGSWNGQWSGQDNTYAIVRPHPRSQKDIERFKKLTDKGSFHYRWSDGWSANVEVKEVSSAEGRRLKKVSKGFCGYDWMVTSIICHGEIKI